MTPPVPQEILVILPATLEEQAVALVTLEPVMAEPQEVPVILPAELEALPEERWTVLAVQMALVLTALLLEVHRPNSN